MKRSLTALFLVAFCIHVKDTKADFGDGSILKSVIDNYGHGSLVKLVFIDEQTGKEVIPKFVLNFAHRVYKCNDTVLNNCTCISWRYRSICPSRRYQPCFHPVWVNKHGEDRTWREGFSEGIKGLNPGKYTFDFSEIVFFDELGTPYGPVDFETTMELKHGDFIRLAVPVTPYAKVRFFSDVELDHGFLRLGAQGQKWLDLCDPSKDEYCSGEYYYIKPGRYPLYFISENASNLTNLYSQRHKEKIRIEWMHGPVPYRPPRIPDVTFNHYVESQDSENTTNCSHDLYDGEIIDIGFNQGILTHIHATGY